MLLRALACGLIPVLAALAQSFPEPPKPDVPFLIHAGNLVETETNEATDESDEKETRYAVPGPTSPARTPLALPELAMKPETVDPGLLELYRFEPVDGRREILLKRKKKILARPFHVTALPSDRKGVYRLRVAQTLEPGEYCLTPQGANAVYCFTVF